MSDGIDLRYRQMLEDQDGEVSVLLEEESKTLILPKDGSGATNDHLNQSSKKIVVASTANKEYIVSGGGYASSSNDRLTPANEYDIAVDSVSNPSR